MKIIAIIYLINSVLSILITPFMFGQKKKYDEYNAREWLINIIIYSPLYYLLFKIAIQQ